jgi:hypothetical protein
MRIRRFERMRGRLGGNRKGYIDYECERKKEKGKGEKPQIKSEKGRTGFRRGGGGERGGMSQAFFF